HTGGRWPFWLNPRQAIVIPVGGSKFFDYAQKVQQSLVTRTDLLNINQSEFFKKGESRNNNSANHYFIDIDLSSNSLNKMIKTAQLAQYNFIVVVGEKEKDTRTVNVRQRDGEILGNMTIDQLLSHFEKLDRQYL
ncbi:14884_t:CDS:1, partial [Acaulospora morrowiae]